MISTIVLATPLVITVTLVKAAPVLTTRDDSQLTSSTDLKVFTDAFVDTCTGGEYQTCLDSGYTFNVDLGLYLNTAVSSENDFNTWAQGYCFDTYNDQDLCGELGAYLTATYYAYEHGWAGADYFACLGSDRLDRWHNTLTTLCGYSSCPQDQCQTITSQWNVFYDAYTSVDASVYASYTTDLQSAGIFTLLDAYSYTDLSSRDVIFSDLGSFTGLGLDSHGLWLDSDTDSDTLIATKRTKLQIRGDDLLLGSDTVLDSATDLDSYDDLVSYTGLDSDTALDYADGDLLGLKRRADDALLDSDTILDSATDYNSYGDLLSYTGLDSDITLDYDDGGLLGLQRRQDDDLVLVSDTDAAI